MKIVVIISSMGLISIQAWGHATYTGYSGAPLRQTCSRSCHPTHNFAPTITLTGFPPNYIPEQQYSIAIAHSGGLTIKQFNCSVRMGMGSSNAGVIAAGTGTSVYNASGETNGVHFTSVDQNSGTFLWTAPSLGFGEVRLYWAGLQGDRSNGGDTAIILICNENMSGVEGNADLPLTIELAQNYPNPFNAETIISFSLAQPSHVDLLICNILGQSVFSWSDDIYNAVTVLMHWDGKSNEGLVVPSGLYFYQLRTPDGELTRQMIFLK